MTDYRGSFVWYELLTKDTEAAESFYTQVMSWGTMPLEESDQPYTMWTSEGMPVGGLMTLPEEAVAHGAPPHWLAYIATDDVDATTAKAKDLGATVLVDPMDVPSAGRISVLTDPQGAQFGVYAAAPDATPPGNPKFGNFSWVELATSDCEAAVGFYSDLFGWQKTEHHDMGPMGIYQMFGPEGGETMGGAFNKPAEMPGPPNWLYYVEVADVAAAASKIEELGGKILNGPMEVPGGDQIAQCMDPQGAAFAVHQAKPAE